MLALVLLPTVSHALALAQGGKTAWAEVCTPQGMKRVALDDAPGAGDITPPQGDIHLEHCPYCTLSGVNAVPPDAPFRTTIKRSLLQSLRAAATPTPAPVSIDEVVSCG